MLKSLVLAAAGALAMIVPAHAGPVIFAGAYEYFCCDPDPGPRDSQLRAYVDETAFPLPVDMAKPEWPLGIGMFGRPAYARAFISNDLRTWGGHVLTPNTPTASGITGVAGGSATVSLYRTFQKESDLAYMGFTFTGWDVTVTASREGGPRCPLGDDECLLAKNFVHIKLLDENDDVIRDYIEWIQVRSVDTAISPTGYVAERPIGGGAFLYSVTNGLEGATIGLTDPQDSPGYIGVNLESLADKQIFSIQVDLLVQAFDRGAAIGPGRLAEAFARDPIADIGGILMEYGGVTEIDIAAPPPTGVPAPTSLVLLAPLALAATRWRRAPGPAGRQSGMLGSTTRASWARDCCQPR